MADDWQRVQEIASAVKDGKHAWAIRTIPPALETIQDEEARAYLLGCLATAYQQGGEFDKGVRAATKALKLAPSLHHVRVCRATCLLQTGQASQALADLNRLLEQAPEDALGYFVRSATYLVLANKAAPELKPIMLRRSLADIDEALHHDPADRAFVEHRDALRGLVGERVVAAEGAIDGWELAGKIAVVAGKFVGGVIS